MAKAAIQIPQQVLSLNSEQSGKLEFKKVTDLLVQAGVQFTFQPVE